MMNEILVDMNFLKRTIQITVETDNNLLRRLLAAE